MLQFGLIKPEFNGKGTPQNQDLGRLGTTTRPFSAEHSSNKSNHVNKKASRLSSGVFNEDLGEFERDFDEDLA